MNGESMAGKKMSARARVRTGKRGRRHGTVLILVVGVLALLALMGTAYILMAKSEKATSKSVSETENLELARNAMMAYVLERIQTSYADEDGRPLAFALPWATGKVYQVGDVVYLQGTWHVFRCNTKHSSVNGNKPGAGSSWTPVGPQGNPGEYRTARLWTYGELGTKAQNWPGRTEPRDGQGYANVSSQDLPWLFGGKNKLSTLWPAGFDPTGGTDKVNAVYYFIAPQTSPTVAVADPQAAWDGIWMLLPFSGVNGVRYRYAVKIIDTSGRVNLNVGNVDTNQADATGQYMDTAPIYGQPICLDGSGQLLALHNGSAQGLHGRWPSGQAGLAAWQSVIWRWEQPGKPGGAMTEMFDPTDELELRTYTNRGTGYVCRPQALLPKTLAPAAAPNQTANRDYFTTQSMSREFMPYPTIPTLTTGVLPYKVDLGSGPQSYWPYPRKININVPLTPAAAQLSQASITEIVKSTANLASLMRGSGFSNDEARGFAANYLSYRIGGGTGTPYSLPNGPSFIDGTGIHVRGTITADFPSDLGFDVNNPKRIYVGFTAQPFVNEVVAQLAPTGAGAAATVSEVDSGVELTNPFNFDIDVSGWQLVTLDDGGGVVGSVTLSGTVPKNGYMVVTNGSGSLASGSKTGLGMLAQNGQVLLTRPVQMTSGKVQVAVDSFDYRSTAANLYAGVTGFTVNQLFPPPASLDPRTTPKTNYSFQRSNVNPWQGAIALFNAGSGPITAPDPGGHTLGGPNNVSLSGNDVPNDPVTGTPSDPTVFFTLYDRWGGLASPPVGTDGNYSLQNIRDFNRIMRVTNIADTGATPAMAIPLSWTLAGAAVGQGNPQSDCPHDAAIHFDFKAKPRLSQTADGGHTERVFEGITFLDRSDPTYTRMEAGDPGRRFLTRFPGQININTADAKVLQSIPALNALMGTAGTLLVNYRDRTGPFSDTNAYPGNGFRSVSELLVPLASAALGAPSKFTSFDQRDQVWAQLCNMMTVRSDTYVVYGLLQAVQQSDPTHDNKNDWYDNGGATGAGAKQKVLAQRRFIALVDLSTCNYRRPMPWVQDMRYSAGDTAISLSDGNMYYVIAGQEVAASAGGPPGAAWLPGNTYTGPRILAIKDLPQ